MGAKDYFKKQNEGTATKILFYQSYLEQYLVKVLMQFGVCVVCDLFCGTGYNGREKGSPIVLLEKIDYILSSKTLQAHFKTPQVYIVFNDESSKHIEELTKNIDQIKIKLKNAKNIRVLIRADSFSNILTSKVFDVLNNKAIPKFFFLDPFNYSIKLDEIKKIFNLPLAEILLFIPTWHVYRFLNKANEIPKLSEFVKNFTLEENFSTFHDFLLSIRNRLCKELATKFVGSYQIDVGRSKNTLFLITRHPVAMNLANQIFMRYSSDGTRLMAKEIIGQTQQKTLFDLTKMKTKEYFFNVENFQIELVNELKAIGEMTNIDIIKFTVQEQFLLKHAREIIINLKKKNLVDYRYYQPDKTRGCYIAIENWNKKICKIIYEDGKD